MHAEDMNGRLRLLLNGIPKGRVTTYGILAERLGTSPRAVGMMLSCNDPKKAPCYKVVKADGSLGGYSGAGGVKTKVKLLENDGIDVRNGKVDAGKFFSVA